MLKLQRQHADEKVRFNSPRFVATATEYLGILGPGLALGFNIIYFSRNDLTLNGGYRFNIKRASSEDNKMP